MCQNYATLFKITILALPGTRLAAMKPTQLPQAIQWGEFGDQMASLGELYGRHGDTLGCFLAYIGSTASSHEANIAN